MKFLYYICKTNSFCMTLSGYIFCIAFAYVGLALKMSHEEMTIMSILCFFIMAFLPIILPIIMDLFLHMGLSEFSHLVEVGSKKSKNFPLILQIIFIVLINVFRLKIQHFDSDYLLAIVSSIIVVVLLHFVKCTTYGVCDVIKSQI